MINGNPDETDRAIPPVWLGCFILVGIAGLIFASVVVCLLLTRFV
jgi:hypothetical protein